MISHSEGETRRLGAWLGAQLAPGDVLLLEGEMGAGKSVLARGIALGLGIDQAMPSPTFTIMQPYEGRCKLYHFDLYRLEQADELYAMGLEEFLGGDGVALVEWPGRCPEAMPARRLTITIEYGGEETQRRISWAAEGGFPLPNEKEVDF